MTEHYEADLFCNLLFLFFRLRGDALRFVHFREVLHHQTFIVFYRNCPVAVADTRALAYGRLGFSFGRLVLEVIQSFEASAVCLDTAHSEAGVCITCYGGPKPYFTLSVCMTVIYPFR